MADAVALRVAPPRAFHGGVGEGSQLRLQCGGDGGRTSQQHHLANSVATQPLHCVRGEGCLVRRCQQRGRCLPIGHRAGRQGVDHGGSIGDERRGALRQMLLVGVLVDRQGGLIAVGTLELTDDVQSDGRKSLHHGLAYRRRSAHHLNRVRTERPDGVEHPVAELVGCRQQNGGVQGTGQSSG
jgi:hypothetical protein